MREGDIHMESDKKKPKSLTESARDALEDTGVEGSVIIDGETQTVIVKPVTDKEGNAIQRD